MKPRLLIARALDAQPWWFRLGASFFVLIYRGILAIRRHLYRAGYCSVQKLPGLCISVGNLAVGGTGKSPLVLELAKLCLELGKRPVILSRGYKSGLKSQECAVYLGGQLLTGNFKARKGLYADEARMQSALLNNVPVVVGRKRFAAAQFFLRHTQEPPDVWILDDGLQHWGLQRDVDLLLLDWERPLGNGCLLPRGPLREEPADAWERADMILWTRAPGRTALAPPQMQEFMALPSWPPSYPVVFRQALPQLIVEGQLQPQYLEPWHRPLLLVTAIAQPFRLISSLQTLGLAVETSVIAADHERLSARAIKAKASHCRAILTTAKDYWREPEVFSGQSLPVFIAGLELELPKEPLIHLLSEALPCEG